LGREFSTQLWAVRRWGKKMLSCRDAIDCVSIQLKQISEVGNVTNDTKGNSNTLLRKINKMLSFFNRIREDKNKFENNYFIDRIYNALL
jgi:hypothetical protein